MKVLLIVPAYNEEENIVRVCNNLRENFLLCIIFIGKLSYCLFCVYP